jgi:hypothetical protein
MKNKKKNFASTQVQKMAKFERKKQQNYLYFSRRKTLRNKQ